MGNTQEKEIDLLETFIEMQVGLLEYNSSICEGIWREISNTNSSHPNKNVYNHDGNLTSFFDMCINKTELEEITTQPYILPWYGQVAWTLVFAAMILFAIIGNLIVIWIIVAHKCMRTITNLFLLNLAVADFLLASGNAIFTFVFLLHNHWPFGRVFCVISNVIANLTVSTSVFTILVLSLARFLAVIFPLRPRISKGVVVTIIILVWTLSLLLCLPSFLYATTITYKYSAVQKRTICYLQWPDAENGVSYLEYIFNIVFFGATYVAPVLCMSVTYPWIAFALGHSKAIGEYTDHQNKIFKSKQRVVHMLVALVLLFVICWLPYHVYFLYIFYNREIIHTQHIQHIYLAIFWLAMSNSCFNPIVYYSMNARFRDYFQQVLCIQSKPADVGTDVGGKNYCPLDAKESSLTTKRICFYRKSSPKQKAGHIADVFM